MNNRLILMTALLVGFSSPAMAGSDPLLDCILSPVLKPVDYVLSKMLSDDYNESPKKKAGEWDPYLYKNLSATYSHPKLSKPVRAIRDRRVR